MAKEIVFFDLETNVPKKPGQRFWILEFGAIVVCPQKLVEQESYCTLIRPEDLNVVGWKSRRCDGITRGAVENAPSFEEVADKIFRILNGRIWAGHNIQRFDCVRISEAFKEIGQPAPVPVGIIDSLCVLRQKFGRRAGNMKMATLAAYFGLGEQKHRSLDDARMNLEVLKHCATVLFLESSLPGAVDGKWQHPPPSFTVRSRSNILEMSSCTPTNKQWQHEKPAAATTIMRLGSSNQKLVYRDQETSRRSPSTLVNYHPSFPYSNRNLGKMTEKAKNVLCNSGSRSVSMLLKHSHMLLRV